MAKLTIHFRGICAHFRHLVPGVPHRVVLPNATALRFGLVDIPDESTRTYVLPPHFPVLRAPTPEMQALLDVRGVMVGGVIYDGARLQVANAKDKRVEYGARWEDVAHLSHYVEAYQFSDEVVLGGRASCYFDVMGGTAAPDIGVNQKIAGVSITMETDGPPELLVSPFFQATNSKPAESRITLFGDDVRLLVANAGLGCGEGGADGFDFLLNYLTLKGGLPRYLRKRPPQIAPTPSPFPEALAEALKQLAHFASPRDLTLPDFDKLLFNQTLSCSNTQYP